MVTSKATIKYNSDANSFFRFALFMNLYYKIQYKHQFDSILNAIL